MATTTIDQAQQAREREEKASSFWWLGLLRGLALVVLGIAVLFWPVKTGAALLMLIGWFVVAYGAIAIIQGLITMFRSFGAGLLAILLGVLGISLGWVILQYPSASFQTFMLFTGLWLIISGIMGMTTSSSDQRARDYSVAGGLLSILIGVLLFFSPAVNGVLLFWLMGFYGLIAGIVAMYGAFRIRSVHEEIVHSHQGHPQQAAHR